MRKLTVKREKSFVGCAAKIHIYIEHAEGDVTISGVPCREIGELKNGTEAVFEISEGELRVFAIADKLSKDYCKDCYRLKAGEEDVNLSGKCHFNLATGNAFRFDGNDAAGMKEARREGVRKGLIVLVISILVGTILGFGITSIIIEIINSTEKVFDTGEMTITLTEGFTESSVIGDAAFSSNHVNVIATKESFSKIGFLSNCSAAEFARILVAGEGLTDSEVKTEDGLTYFIYDGTERESGRTYRYYVFIYKTDDAFWNVHFAVNLRKIKKYDDKIPKWAASVSFE